MAMTSDTGTHGLPARAYASRNDRDRLGRRAARRLGTRSPVRLDGKADQPSSNQLAPAIIAFYQGASFDPAFMTGVLMEGASFALLLVVLAKVADLVGGADGGSRWIGWLIVAGAALEMAFGIFGYLATLMAGSSGPITEGCPTRATSSCTTCASRSLARPRVLPLWMVPLGVAIIRTRFFPPWLGWAFIVNAAALLPTLYLPVDLWDPVSGLPSVWILVMAAMMIRRPERYSGGAVNPETPAATDSGAAP